MKWRPIPQEVLDKQRTRGADVLYNEQPYIEAIKEADTSPGRALEVELEGDTERQTVRRLNRAAKGLGFTSGVVKIKIKPSDPGYGQDILRFRFRTPRTPRTPKPEGEATATNGRRKRADANAPAEPALAGAR